MSTLILAAAPDTLAYTTDAITVSGLWQQHGFVERQLTIAQISYRVVACGKKDICTVEYTV